MIHYLPTRQLDDDDNSNFLIIIIINVMLIISITIAMNVIKTMIAMTLRTNDSN